MVQCERAGRRPDAVVIDNFKLFERIAIKQRAVDPRPRATVRDA